jgi:putative transposase
MKHRLKKYSHKVGLNYWHFEWCTKYRYQMMKKYGNNNLVKAAILKTCNEYNIKVHILEVLPEHVHMLISLPKGMGTEKAFHRLKGRSAFLIFRNKPKFRLRYPQGHFWARGGCAITVGYNDFDSAMGYIKKQLEHHSVELIH